MKVIFILFLSTFFLILSPFNNNEKLTFSIKYGFISAGEATLDVSGTTYKDSIPVLEFSSITKTNKFFDKIFKVRDEIISIWDLKNEESLKFTKIQHEGFYHQKRIHLFYPKLKYSTYIKHYLKKNKIKEKKIPIKDKTQDILSAFYSVRKKELTVGDTVFVNLTTDGKSYVAGVFVHKKEKIKTIFGRKECLKIEPILKGEAIFKQTGNIFIWVTNDAHKIPVKLQSKIIFGSFYAILKEAKNVPYEKK